MIALSMLLSATLWWLDLPGTAERGTAEDSVAERMEGPALPFAFALNRACTQTRGVTLCVPKRPAPAVSMGNMRGSRQPAALSPVLAAAPHTEPVVEGELRWLRVSGLEWQAFYVETIGQGQLGGQELPVERWGHPNAPHEGWEVMAIPRQMAPAAGARVQSASLAQVPPKQGQAAAVRIQGCPLVPLQDFPVQLLYDAQGALRMMRLQGLPQAELASLEGLGCVAAAMVEISDPGSGQVELQLTLR